MLGHDPAVNRSLTTAFAYFLLPQVLFYGLSSVFMAILNTRNVFGPPAWAPVCNNIVAIATLVVYLLVPGELSADPVRMGNPKLLVLGIGMTLGTVTQVVVLLVAIRRERISLRPLWGVDDRLKKFGAMALAMVLYVVISQIGLIVGNRIASGAAASGPAIYNYTWLVLMLPFGIIGVTVLTVVMPRLSRLSRAGQRSGFPGRRYGGLLPVARQPQSPRRAADQPCGGADHSGDNCRVADRRPRRPRRRSAPRTRVADPQLGRRRFTAAAVLPRRDHDADHRRGHVGRPPGGLRLARNRK
jgi:hypothetical protein